MAEKNIPSESENRRQTDSIPEVSPKNKMFLLAFRTLLIVLMLLGLPVIGILIYLNLSK
jgi:cell division septal protein FtsQ